MIQDQLYSFEKSDPGALTPIKPSPCVSPKDYPIVQEHKTVESKLEISSYIPSTSIWLPGRVIGIHLKRRGYRQWMTNLQYRNPSPIKSVCSTGFSCELWTFNFFRTQLKGSPKKKLQSACTVNKTETSRKIMFSSSLSYLLDTSSPLGVYADGRNLQNSVYCTRVWCRMSHIIQVLYKIGKNTLSSVHCAGEFSFVRVNFYNKIPFRTHGTFLYLKQRSV